LKPKDSTPARKGWKCLDCKSTSKLKAKDTAILDCVEGSMVYSLCPESARPEEMKRDDKATFGWLFLLENPMQGKYRKAFYAQRREAGVRGIGWELTFEQWIEWWGEDITRRGNHFDQLQMQRFEDKGPYAIGNIQKGAPKQNRKTQSAMLHNARAEKAAAEHQARLDAMMWAPSADEDDRDEDGFGNEIHELGMKPRALFPEPWQIAAADKNQRA
jgi:hypothetical protein